MLEQDSVEFKTLIQEVIKEVVIYPYKVCFVIKTGLGIIDELDTSLEIKKQIIYEEYSSAVKMEKSS